MKILRTNSEFTLTAFFTAQWTAFHRHRRKTGRWLANTVFPTGSGWSNLLCRRLTGGSGLLAVAAIFLMSCLVMLSVQNGDEVSLASNDLEDDRGRLANINGGSDEANDLRPSQLSRKPNPMKRLQELVASTLSIRAFSSKDRVSITVDNTLIYEDRGAKSGRGIHVLVLNQDTGAVMAKRVFDTYSPREDESLVLFVNLVSPGRIFVFAIKDEGTFQLRQPARDLLIRLGSREMKHVGWRDMWAMVTVKEAGEVVDASTAGHGEVRGRRLAEGYTKSPDFSSWGQAVEVVGEMLLRPTDTVGGIEDLDESWTSGSSGSGVSGTARTAPDVRQPPHCWKEERRREFCDRIEGYGSVCSCSNPAPITFNPPPPVNNQAHDVPVAIIASNRPHYLHRMLQSLLSARGADPAKIVVFIDGFYEETLAVAQLFGLRGVQHSPVGVGNARISQHVKISISSIFSMFPLAQYAIVLEEDLDVSPDFFSYFSQTMSLLGSDPSLYCVSAWNDLGYEHTSADPSALYRVETMPGLGWMLSRRLFETELEPAWPGPERSWDWDMWMRLEDVRRGRECIVPDVSRTYHFGASGLNMNSYFHDVYFSKHSFYTSTDEVELLGGGVDQLAGDQYDEELDYGIRQAAVIDPRLVAAHCGVVATTGAEINRLGNQTEVVLVDASATGSGGAAGIAATSPLVPMTHGAKSEDRGHVLYISMRHHKDFTSWLGLAKCLNIWDLDARGYHRGVWRLHLNARPVFVVGHPFSPYSKYKPNKVPPVKLKKINSPDSDHPKQNNRPSKRKRKKSGQ